MVIDEPTLMNTLQDLAIKYRLERERTKSVTRTIAKAKQEAIMEAMKIVNGMEKMPVYVVQRDQEANHDENPWRYFTTADPGCVVRTKPGEQSRYYLANNDGHESCELDFEWWNKAAQCGDIFREITESEAAEILGGKCPWATQRDHPSHSP